MLELWRRHAALAAALAALVAAGCSSGEEPAEQGQAPAPTRVRYHEPSHGWTADVPAAWPSIEVGPQFVRGASFDDPTVLVLWTYRSSSPSQALAEFQELAKTGTLAPSGTRTTKRLSWARSRGRGADPAVAVETAVAAHGGDSHLAALFARPAELDRLVAKYLLPALDSFVPGPPDPPASVLAAVPREPAYWPTHGWASAPPSAQGVDPARLDALVSSIREKEMPIDSVTVVRHGYVVLDVSFPPFAAGALGDPYAAGSLHQLHSATKSVTSALVGIALEGAGRRTAGVDTPLLRFFAPYVPASTDARKRALTLEHVLSMTAGLAWKEWGYAYEPGSGNDLVELVESPNWSRYAIDRPMATGPGTSFLYNSGASHLLSAVVSVLTQQSAADLAAERLFGPLGIRAFEWPAGPEQVTAGWGGLLLRPLDLAKLAFLYLHGGSWAGREVVPADWVRRSTTDQVREPLYEYGYQWWLDRADGYAYMAGRFGQMAFVAPEDDLVAVITAHLPEEASTIAPRWLFERYVLSAAR